MCSFLLEVAQPQGFKPTSEPPTLPGSSPELQPQRTVLPRCLLPGAPSPHTTPPTEENNEPQGTEVPPTQMSKY